MRFYLPQEGADRPYLTSGLSIVPTMGSTVKISRSDNPQIPPGLFKIVSITHDIEIVNQNRAKAGMQGEAPLIELERISGL